MNYSSYQKDIFNEVVKGNTNIIINAVAGSGKTTTIVECCKRLKCNENDVKFLAFNKNIADELKTKLHGYADVSTMHAFGFSILKDVYNIPKYKRYVKVDNYRYRKYIKENIYSLSSLISPDTPTNRVYGFISNVCTLLDLARVNLIQHGNKDILRQITDEYNINLLFDEIEVTDILLADAYKMPKNQVIDFTDMLILPLFTCKKFIPTYKYVFIDECQDLSKAQRELMLCAAQKGRFIAVGDRKQAINGFAGADCLSFDKIAQMPNTIEMPLSVNYRCGKNMVKLAQEIVPQIKAHDNAIEGEITHINNIDKNTFKPNDMILCRTSAPLVGACMYLIEQGITAVVKGKDIAQELKNIVNNANTNDIDGVLMHLNTLKEKCWKSIKNDRKCTDEQAKESTRYQTLCDRCKCIENICNYSIENTTELKYYIDKLFSDDHVKNAVTLSTVHKAKGLEANRVAIFLPNKLPLTYKNQTKWQFEQEMNLKYVALTRAKKELIIVDMSEKELLKLRK